MNLSEYPHETLLRWWCQINCNQIPSDMPLEFEAGIRIMNQIEKIVGRFQIMIYWRTKYLKKHQ